MLKKKCERCKEEKPIALIRTKEVCSSCYEILNLDNKRRTNKGMGIPKNFNLLPQIRVYKNTTVVFRKWSK